MLEKDKERELVNNKIISENEKKCCKENTKETSSRKPWRQGDRKRAYWFCYRNHAKPV